LLLGSLGVSQTVGYGVLIYAFAVYLHPMASELHASPGAITAAMTLAVLITAAAAVPVGRWLDQHGGRGLMTAGSILATLSVVAWSRVTSVAGLYVVFAGIGVASAIVLYEATFAVVIAVTEPRRRSSAILTITIIAGFASTIFLPLTATLVERYGWRDSLLVLAVLLGTVTIPIHATLVPRRGAPAASGAVHAIDTDSMVREALRDRGFWLMVTAFTAHSAAITIVIVHLVAYLVTLGHPVTFAASITGLLGVLSVTGRLVVTGLGRRWSMATLTAAVFAIQAFAIAVLPLVGRLGVGAAACVVLFGLGFGIGTIARPILLAQRYGTNGYATIAGALTLPLTIAKATGPLVAAVLITAAHSYLPAVAIVSAGCLVSTLCLALLARDGERRAG
jgi:predicted MFS family arabinose efflux permease